MRTVPAGTLSRMPNAWAQSAIALKWNGTIASPATYYLSPSGSDSNTGVSTGSPWLTPKHNLNCGDTILAASSTSYVGTNFRFGEWGFVTCINGNNVAWLKCATFDACKGTISGSNNPMAVTASYWGVQGFENTATVDTNQCFLVYPPNFTQSVHHVIFANDIANGCEHQRLAVEHERLGLG